MSKNKVTRKTKVVCKPRKSNAAARRPSTTTPPLRQRSDGGPPARRSLPRRPPARRRCHHDPCNDDPPATTTWPGTAMTRVRHVFGALELTGFFLWAGCLRSAWRHRPRPRLRPQGAAPRAAGSCLGSPPGTLPRLCAVAAPQPPSTLAPGALGDVRAASFKGGSSSVKTLGGDPPSRCGLVSRLCAGQLALHMALTMRGCGASTASLSDSKSRPTRWGSKDGRGREHGKVLDSGLPTSTPLSLANAWGVTLDNPPATPTPLVHKRVGGCMHNPAATLPRHPLACKRMGGI
jgi:hypothetical protein